MGNIKNKKNGKISVIASGQSTGITVTNPKLLLENQDVTSVDEVLERHQEAVSRMERNISWLAEHGGGGSGTGGGGGGSDITEATCNITVNGLETNSQILLDKSGLQILLNNISSKTPKSWKVIVRIGATQILQTQASYINPMVQLSYDKIKPYLINYTGNIYIGASYEDETNGIYGQASWSGSLVENIVNITTTNEAFTWETIDTAQFTYKYSVGIIGLYTLGITVIKDNVEILQKSYNITINSNNQQTKTISIKELLDINEDTEASSIVGVYNVKATLYNNDNGKISGSCENTITIISDQILVSSTKMSTKQDSPVEVSLSGSINAVFTAYLQGASTYKYSYTIGGEIIGADSIGYFGTEVNDFIPITNKSWAQENSVLPIYLNITSGDRTVTMTYWVKFVAASSTFLNIDETSRSHIVSEFLSRDYNSGAQKFNLQHDGYENGGSIYKITSTLQVHNENSLSAITVLPSGQPYLRLSNGAYGILSKWNFNNREYTLPNLLTAKQFTISICFKADYHPDDYRSILCCGNINTSTGELISGISVDVHDVYINNESKVKLTDNTINMLDIVCIQTTTKDIVNDVEVEQVSYIIKIYLDGVLTSISKYSKFPELGDVIYLGGRIYSVTNAQGVTTQIESNLCDCNIYNLQVYDTVLTDFDIVVNYINNKVSTQYINGNPNFNIIIPELKTNFCERATDGSIISYMFKNGQYNIDFLLSGTGELDGEKLNNYAKVLGIPIMLIDVSTDDSWTFNNFVTQQTAGNVSLPDTSGKQIQYWDPNGGNTSIVKINNATIGLQGTSTLADAVKNLNITVPNDTVFIPKNTWFPEQTYTLKADVVDSSHSNNASIGTFINEVLGYQESDGSSYFPFDPTAINNVYDSDYKKNQQKDVTLKHTVEGFPIFLIMKFNTNIESTVSITPLGIYSFNLGRDAYRNLGFKKLESVKDSTGDKVQITTFPYLIEGATITETDSNSSWIEIKDTTSLKDLQDVTTNLPEGFDSSKGDFWQNDDNILNARYEVRYPKGKSVTDYQTFKTFVTNIMQLPIEGTLSTDSLGNVTYPNITDSYDLYRLEGTSSYIKTGQKQAIATDINTLPQNLGFNQDSIYKYFSIGILFGLVDNFGKNSTFRNWGIDGQYYIDFYDLDSALGGGNQGQLDITPDVWIKYIANTLVEGKKYGYVGETFNKDKGLSGTVVSANHNKLWLSMDTQFYRAYSNNTGVNSAYTQYWYNLRYELQNKANKAGYSNFVDYFINDYYIKQVKDCGPLLFNYDYKLKYLLQFKDDSYNNTKDLTKLHGRKIAYTKDWLSKHILFLDSLYYWRDSSQVMNFLNNLNSKGSNTVYNTPEEFPMKSNTPIIMYNSVGNTTQTFYFMPTNKEVFVNAGSNSSNSALNWNFTNAPNIIQFGNDEYPLSSMNINVLSYAANNSSISANGYSAITELSLANNSMFAPSFTLDAFEQGSISEIRTLDFRATSGNNFSLSLNRTAISGEVYTKYTKLTKIDISNSTCISNIDIPAVPLTDLQVNNSNITSLILTNQKYLKQVNLTGCNQLLTIQISGCDAYTDFSVSNLQNLKEVIILNCPSIKTINIQGCNNLTKVDIENCGTLQSIQINRCPSLTGNSSTNYITISECSSLQSLDLSNNQNLTTLRITQSNQSNINTLLLNNTSIGYITGDNVDTSLLDLYSYSSLINFAIYANSSVTAIQFANNQNNPIPIKSTFQQCPNLERIYGNIIITNSTYNNNYGTFRGCSKFSVHGDANNWKGSSIKNSNGVVKTPWEIITQSSNNESNIYNQVTWANGFVTGKRYTNIKFSNSSNILNYTFYGTNISQFDIYYILFILATSEITVNQTINRGFYGLQNAHFVWSSSNQPNRYMFYRCSMIVGFNEAFTSSSPTFLWSPEDGKDNGLFSPLTNLNSISVMFSGSVVFSKKLFKRTTGTYPLTSFSWQGIQLICDTDTDFSNYSNFSNDIWKATHAKETGNLDGFFDGIPNLSYIWGTFNMYTLNFNTLVFPKKITTIGGSFNVTYATGTLDLQVVFQENTPCNQIANSFVVNDTQSIYGDKATFPITDNIFNNIRGIQIIGYSGNSGGGSITETSFRGAGLRKYINQDTFPKNIVKNCPNLITFAGFFREVENKSFASEVKIPGNMFINNYSLQNVAALMYNCEFPFKLSSEGFKNCTSLNNVAYFCYHDLSTTSRSKLTGEIPYRLFYHGLTQATVTLKGTNQETEPDETFDISTLLSTTHKFNNYNRNITNMERCFYGCVNLDAYNNIDNKSFIENNPTYTPYKWMYNESTQSWSQGNDPYLQEASWGYTGVPSTQTSSYKYLESANITRVSANTIDGKVETLNYCCSPDLLMYCTSISAPNIIGLFENCGLNYSQEQGGNKQKDESLYAVGLQGRIPPYLLKPIPNVQNIQSLFQNCRRLSSYQTSAGVIYQIPKDFLTYAPKVAILAKSFQGLSYIYGTVLNIFDSLTSALDIRCIFAISIYGADAVSSGSNVLSGIFINNNISKASGAFSGNDLALSNSVLGVTETNIYANVGIANIKATNNFTLAKLPSSSNIGYVYYKWGSNANDSAISNQNYNYN